ncbi:rubisco accumulation factor 1, chloroplastic-like [Tasmannia lanceolata]|uniref:rubisco accumulation factor 1, chloroplastic-like n=1 Tax=Tasmannia lanceolata TaxID=3420 RepID=UPI0040649AA8
MAFSLQPISIFPKPSSFLNPHPHPLNLHPTTHKTHLKPISATPTPTPPPNEVYQPFRPPPSKPTSQIDTDTILETLRNRLGLWFEYAPLISSLLQHGGFSPSSLEESTGLSGVEQNRLVVASKVRDSLSDLDPETLSFFDLGGAEILYELRFLNAAQRAAAACWVAVNRADGRGAGELARAMKDFPRRRREKGWESFSAALPGDCLAFMQFRLSREQMNQAEKVAVLEQAMEVAETDAARQRVEGELRKVSKGEQEGGGIKSGVEVKVPVVRLKMGEVGEAKRVVVLPVVEAGEGELGVVEAPKWRVEGEFGVVVGEKGWRRWVVLPGWGPVVDVGPGVVVVAFGDSRVLPWKGKRGYEGEGILVVADRGRNEVVEEEGFYLVWREDVGLVVERGGRLIEMGVREGLGSVVLVVRPPKFEEEGDQLDDEDWV